MCVCVCDGWDCDMESNVGVKTQKTMYTKSNRHKTEMYVNMKRKKTNLKEKIWGEAMDEL